jgi:hypothetical protein
MYASSSTAAMRASGDRRCTGVVEPAGRFRPRLHVTIGTAPSNTTAQSPPEQMPAHSASPGLQPVHNLEVLAQVHLPSGYDVGLCDRTPACRGAFLGGVSCPIYASTSAIPVRLFGIPWLGTVACQLTATASLAWSRLGRLLPPALPRRARQRGRGWVPRSSSRSAPVSSCRIGGVVFQVPGMLRSGGCRGLACRSVDLHLSGAAARRSSPLGRCPRCATCARSRRLDR